MSSSLITINPGLLALIEGRDSSLLLFARELMVLDCHVAGTSYQDLDEAEPTMNPGDRFLLIREPQNEHDTFAVAIYTAGRKKLGYLPRNKNETIARLMDAGKIIFGTLISKQWNDNWLKLSIHVYLIDK
ncbi:MAG TPA: HIRAN domain-containing protein [Bacteroidia bacterium]|nr:HIRAN domain-containing protein [Bacteroidia bacterium]